MNFQKDMASKTTPTYLNIGCGGTYITDPAWENIDYTSVDGGHVKRMNVLHDLDPSQAQYEAVYCSHFIEHIPLSEVSGFLKRCHSLTAANGLLRIVVPDGEFLLREYLKHKDSGNDALAEFAYVNFLDQCVRQIRGGRLGEFYGEIASGGRPELVDYATYLNGVLELQGSVVDSNDGTMEKVRRLLKSPARVIVGLERLYIRVVLSLLPRGYREQNVSFADVGELHHWMYDFDQLSRLLTGAGYSTVSRLTFDTSRRMDGLFLPLDAHDGAPRKGHHQLFVEAYA